MQVLQSILPTLLYFYIYGDRIDQWNELGQAFIKNFRAVSVTFSQFNTYHLVIHHFPVR